MALLAFTIILLHPVFKLMNTEVVVFAVAYFAHTTGFPLLNMGKHFLLFAITCFHLEFLTAKLWQLGRGGKRWLVGWIPSNQDFANLCLQFQKT